MGYCLNKGIAAIMIREATPEDAPAVLALSREAHDLSFYGRLPMAVEKVKFIIARCIIKSDCFAYVVDTDDIVTGVLFGEVGEAPTIEGRAFFDHIFYVNKGGRGAGLKLVEKARVWAQEQGASILGITVSFGGDNIDRVGKLLEHKGLTRCGGLYLQILENID